MAFSAPFGTDVQPGVDIRIVGGRQVEIHRENVRQPDARSLKRNSPVLQASPRTLYSPPWAFNDHLSKTPPRKVLKPITESDSTGDVVYEEKHVPFASSTTVLPPIQGQHGSDSNDELEDLLRLALKQYDQRRLKEIYISMTSFDPKLTGYVSSAQLENIFIRNHVPVHGTVLKLLINKFATGRNDSKVNYEEVLTYLDKFTKSSAKDGPVPKLNLSALGESLSPRRVSHQFSPRAEHPLTLPPNEVSPRDNLSESGRSSSLQVKQAFADREDAKLKMQIEELFKPYRGRISAELGALKRDFREFDKNNVEFIKQEQLRAICFRGSLPFNDSLLNKLIGRVSRSQTEKVSWKEFMTFLEHIVPATATSSPSTSESKHNEPPSKPVWETRQPLQPLHKRKHLEQTLSGRSSVADPDTESVDEEMKEQLEKDIKEKLKNLPKDHIKVPDSEGLKDEPQDDRSDLISAKMEYDLMEEKLREHALREQLLTNELKKEGFTRLMLAILTISYADKSGFIDSVEAWRLITNYKSVYKLDLTQDDIDRSLNLCTRQNGIKVCVKHLIEALHPAGAYKTEDWERKLLFSQPCEIKYPSLTQADLI